MAARKKQAAPGYEPVKGNPDPSVVRPKTLQLTHYPHRQGPVCGVRPTPIAASAYSTTEPSCPKCAAWLSAAKGNTAAQHPEAVARDRAKQAAEPQGT